MMARTLRLKPLRRQSIVITGASSGIGLAVAREAAKAGARVALVSRNEDALEQICADINQRGGEAIYAVADVGVREELEAVAAFVSKRFGGFDTWVSNAGVGVYAKLEELSEADHRRLFDTNYWGVVNGAMAALPHLKRRGGALITIGSVASDIPSPILSAYAASKHAVKGFIDSLRLELIHDQAPVSVTLIKPSGMQTPFGQHAKNQMDARSQVPPPVYDPHLVAQAVLHAAERPVRDITVGGAGKAMAVFAALMPMAADRLYAKAFFKTATDPSKPRRRGRKNLYGPADDGDVYGDQKIDSRWSLWTSARLRPQLSFGVALLAAGAALALAQRGQRGKQHERVVALS